MGIEVKILTRDDECILENVSAGVFDHPLNADSIREFLTDPRHHLAVAIDNGAVVGFASAVHYVHPDKPPELWINEVGVAPSYRGRGLGSAVLRAVFEVGRANGCKEAWVLTEQSNQAAIALYISVGGRKMAPETAGFKFRLNDAAKRD